MHSEQELKKWANKYRLYKILHGIISNDKAESELLFSGCYRCPHRAAGVYPWIERKGVDCPKDSLVMHGGGRPYSGIFENMHITTMGVDWCMEWVKHV